MKFEKQLPEWQNEGVEPQKELKKDGFRAGYKPPAAYFNWFFNRIYQSVKEVREKLVSEWDDKVNVVGGDISNTKISSIDDITTSFPVPSAGDNTKTFLGKVKKFIDDFNDFKSGIITLGKLANNGSTTASGYALDARYGKTLTDLLSSHKSSGDHDGRYYTETETNNLLNGKANSSHAHDDKLSVYMQNDAPTFSKLREGEIAFGWGRSGTKQVPPSSSLTATMEITDGYAVKMLAMDYLSNRMWIGQSNSKSDSASVTWKELFTENHLANNGTTTNAGYALDARYGKTLVDLINQLSSNLNGRQKLLCGNYVGNGAGVRTISTGLTSVYFGVIATGKGNALYGVDGGSKSFTVAADQNVKDRDYYFVVFGV